MDAERPGNGVPREAARDAITNALASGAPRPLVAAADLLIEALLAHPEWEQILSQTSREELNALARANPTGAAARLRKSRRTPGLSGH